MIIEDVQITPVAIPAEGLKEEKSDIVCALIIEISTDCGLVGIGESPLLLEEENICVPMHTVIRNNPSTCQEYPNTNSSFYHYTTVYIHSCIHTLD